MKEQLPRHNQELLSGTIRIFTADALLVPTGVGYGCLPQRARVSAARLLARLLIILVAGVSQSLAGALWRIICASLMVKGACAVLFVVAAFALFGEFSAEELGRVRAMMMPRRTTDVKAEAQGQES